MRWTVGFETAAKTTRHREGLESELHAGAPPPPTAARGGCGGLLVQLSHSRLRQSFSSHLEGETGSSAVRTPEKALPLALTAGA
ncbi:hypothetical protein EYF80_010405 [Liparis tanakae]|uniref:Uncharacterized protein n=1 Tax=Liparis tanakae TaxID=230148 RepID=A0A4Z2INK4_9TELE|nr:hypothetical protein EYF80_010405 [Liparis tanakae]